MTNIQIHLKKLNDDQLHNVESYLSAQGENINEFIESFLLDYLNGMEANLSEIGRCPMCFRERKINNILKGLPILEAENLGLISIGNESSRESFKRAETYFVLCTRCGWRGFPDKDHIESWKKWY